MDEIYKGHTPVNDKDPTLEYFKEYRAKIAEMKELQQETERLADMIETIRKKSRVLSREIEGMRHIITVMVDQGMDPVEAKLRTEPSERMESMWDWRDHIVTNTGAIGSTGSIGSTGILQGAVGATTTSIPSAIGHGVCTITAAPAGAYGTSYVSQALGGTYHPPMAATPTKCRDV